MKNLTYMHVLLAAAATLLVGILFGYAFGYDVGWERAMSRPVQNGMMYAAFDSFNDCASAGFPIMESYPRQCRMPDGRVFVEEIVVPPTPPDQPIPVEPGNGIGDGQTSGGCAVAGCSQTICAEASEAPNIITTCEYRAEYACYKLTKCERQASGECGWTQTAEFRSCLASPPPLQ